MDLYERCPRFLLKGAPGSLPEARPSTRRPQRRHSTNAAVPASPSLAFPPTPRVVGGSSRSCALRPMRWYSGYNSEHGPPPGIKHELDFSLVPPVGLPQPNPHLNPDPNPPPSPRCALRVISWRWGCDSEHDAPPRRTQIEQRDHELDFDPLSQKTDRSRCDLSVLGAGGRTHQEDGF